MISYTSDRTLSSSTDSFIYSFSIYCISSAMLVSGKTEMNRIDVLYSLRKPYSSGTLGEKRTL